MRIPHSKPFLPPDEDYAALIREIRENGWLTNHGPLVQRFEKEAAEFLGVPRISFLSSGTSGLQCALRTLPRGGEIITTPFSYVATAGTVHWEGFTPVFADIDSNTLCLCPEKAAEKFTPNTRAVLATHVYGLPADTRALDALARDRGVPVMYDAAHCFGVRTNGKSLLAEGDISILSTHATKVFHTANGGMAVCARPEDQDRIDRFRNFGHDGPNRFDGPGINAKNSEFHAALGLAMLPYAEKILNRRRAQWKRYADLLGDEPGIRILSIPENTEHNGAYFPVLGLSPERARKVIDALGAAGIEARRYFSPSLNKIDYMKGDACPVSEAAADSVFCLPLYHTLSNESQDEVAERVRKLI